MGHSLKEYSPINMCLDLSSGGVIMMSHLMSIAASLAAVVALETSPSKPFLGTWITNVSSQALRSESEIKNAVRICREKGVNNVFVVVWNKGVTMYPSKVMESYIGVKQDPIYGAFDPLDCIIREGHKAGIKVHAWFEFGFSVKNGTADSPWETKYPHWLGRSLGNRRLVKNGFTWWNSLNPKPQKFLLEMIKEVVTKYDVDGVQGDDRLPAMPSEGGYDPYTAELYRREKGAQPPENHLDPEWLQWRADKLSQFAETVYHAVKAVKPSCQVSWSPSIFPWSKENYLQDWIKWLDGGYADFVIPQVYRYDFELYQGELLKLKSQIGPDLQKRVFPGILTSLGDGYAIESSLLARKIKLNREEGFGGECLFYFEFLRPKTKVAS
jgi:uncharacterized lipoprotein YddW (UPF0748 family)